MNILFFGVTELGTDLLVRLFQARRQVAGVVVNRGVGFDAQEIKALGQAAGVPCWELDDPGDPAFLQAVREMRPDLILVATYDHKLPPELCRLAGIAAINLHPSYLPEYRGYHPYFWPIAHGRDHSGVTFHLISEQFDSGDIIAQEKIPITPDDTAGTLMQKQKEAAWRLLQPVLNELEQSGRPPQGTPQPAGEHVRAPKLKSNDFFIDWSWPGRRINDLVRALNPHSPAFTKFRGELIGLYQLAGVKGEWSGAPGTVLEVRTDGPLVKTGDGAVLVKVVMAGRRYVLDGAEFCRREAVKPGELFQ